MEKWDLYNAKREKSGIAVCRGEIIPKGLYHLSVSVWIVNQQGQYLLSQRHPKKHTLFIGNVRVVLYFPGKPVCKEQSER